MSLARLPPRGSNSCIGQVSVTLQTARIALSMRTVMGLHLVDSDDERRAIVYFDGSCQRPSSKIAES